MVNTRFLTRPQTGVERVGHCLTKALIAECQHRYGRAIGLAEIAPPSAGRAATEWALPKLPSPALHGHLWEQMVLPFIQRHAILLNLCNSGPVMRRNQVVMLHDAQIHDCPHSYDWKFRAFYRAMQPRLARQARLVLTVSDYSKTRLEHHHVVPEGKAHVIYNGADHIQALPSDVTILPQLGLTSGKFWLTIGSDAPHKNLAILRKAMARHATADCPLVVVGRTGQNVFAADHSDHGPSICRIGAVSDAALRALYEGARALLHPAQSEGFGLPPLEAMLCGCPVIVSNAGALPEICGQAALYADPHEAASWSVCLDRLTSSADLPHDLSRQGQTHAASFRWDRSASQLCDLLEQSWQDIFLRAYESSP